MRGSLPTQNILGFCSDAREVGWEGEGAAQLCLKHKRVNAEL